MPPQPGSDPSIRARGGGVPSAPLSITRACACAGGRGRSFPCCASVSRALLIVTSMMSPGRTSFEGLTPSRSHALAHRGRPGSPRCAS
jgi:hypothetical protein